jgi:hypothetical protein
MNRKTSQVILFGLLLVFLWSFGAAQRTTETGILNGIVTDDQGAPLPGVTVNASSPELMLPQVSVVTDTKGFYRIPQLPVGYYKVVFELDGFKTVIREGIKINLGQITRLNLTMEATVIQESVTVVGEAPTVNVESSSLGVNLDTSFLQNIPSGRDYTSIFELAPGVVSDQGRPASFGSSVLDNVFNLDGVSISSPGTGVYGSIQVGFEIAEEFQIQTGGHPAEYGGVKGSAVNLITKSGGNDITGEVNLYVRDKSFQSDNTAGTPFEGNFVGYNYDYDTTLQLGGPIIKDKLWFFGNFSRTYEETFVEGFPYDKSEHTPCDYSKNFPTAKLSLQINPSMRLVTSWNGWWSLRGQRSAARTRNEDTTWKGDFKSQTFNLSYSYMINNNMIFTARAATAIADLDYLKKNDSPSYYSYDTRTYSGSMGYDYFSQRGRVQFMSDFTYFIDDFYGRHEFKTGVEFNFTWMTSENVYAKDPRNGIGYLLYIRNGLPYRGRDYESYKANNQTSFYGGYIQDRWNPTDRLTLNIGFRFDHQEAIVPKQGEDRSPTEYGGVIYDPRVLQSFKPAVWNNISPRLGLNYDLTGDSKTILKLSYSRYYTLLYPTYFNDLNPNGSVVRYYTLNSDWSLDRMYSFYATSANRIDPDIMAPHLDEVIIGVERELIPDISLAVNYIRKWDRRLIEDVITEALDVEAIKDGTYKWSGYTPVTAVDPFNGQTITFYERNPDFVAQSGYFTNPEPAKRDYSGLEVILKKRYSKNWQLFASYEYSKSTGLMPGGYDYVHGSSAYFNDPNVHVNAIGRLPGERRHQIKIQGTYRAPFGIILSTQYRGYSGSRYTRYVRSGDLGLDLNQGEVSLLAEPLGSRGLPWLHIWDLRVEKEFVIKDRFKLGLIADAFNVLNMNTVTAVESISSASNIEFESTTGIMDPRILRLGFRVRW